jgi:hypothetical protein
MVLQGTCVTATKYSESLIITGEEFDYSNTGTYIHFDNDAAMAIVMRQ